MKKLCLILVTLVLATGAASGAATTEKWVNGWSNFNEPLNLTKSKVQWSVAKNKLTVTFTLVGATPSKLYEVGIEIFCTTTLPTFGQFPIATPAGGGTCPLQTVQGVTKGYAWAAVGVITPDIHGNGTFKVVVGPIASGTYNAEFFALDGAGCGLIGGGGNGSDCNVDFQSPGPTWGNAITFTIP
ncbi:MAG: hypothetical protein HY010_23455 [Acidobacteria bacterium]|nr:hypothetical protein [Acidobacteriota bacterium]